MTDPQAPQDPDHNPDPAAAQGEQPPSRPDGSPDRPSDWRDLFNRDYDYPDDLLTGDMSRRQRRRGKRAWRSADRRERIEWIRQQRRGQPPTSPAVILGAVVVMALIVFSAGYVVPRWFTDGQPGGDREPVSLLTPSGVPVPTIAPTTAPTGQATPTPSEQSGRLTPAAAVAVIRTWTAAFYTRTPAAETYTELLERTQLYLTDEVAQTLREAGDPTYDALAAAHGTSHVDKITVTQPPAGGGAPADTPTRITRLLIAQITVTGDDPNRFELRELVTVVPDRGSWRISAITGGTP